MAFLAKVSGLLTARSAIIRCPFHPVAHFSSGGETPNEESNNHVVDTPSTTEISSQRVRRTINRRDYRFIFPEFLPDPNYLTRNRLAEKLIRKDMLRRRNVVEIPEFYVGSVIAVTIADPNAASANKLSRFLGIVIMRGGTGLRAWCIVRNIIDGQGVEFMYNIYAPQIQKIETIRLEKRLDEELLYLRDAPQEYSYFPQDMEPEILPESVPAPINTIVVTLKPKPWSRYWEYWTTRLQGFVIDDTEFKDERYWRLRKIRVENTYLYRNPAWQQEYVKYDLMLNYRETIPLEEQDAIWEEVGDALEERDKAMRRVAAKRAFARPAKRT